MFHSAPKLNRKCNGKFVLARFLILNITAGFILNFFFAYILFLWKAISRIFSLILEHCIMFSFFIYGNDHLDRYTCRISRQERTLSCLKKRIILSSRKTRLELTKLWKTFGSFLSATRFPSLGSVTDQTTPNAPYPMGRSGV